MKHSNLVSSAVLITNGLLFLILGARVWSAPDVFADALGWVTPSQAMIDALATRHGTSFLLFGIAAIAALAATPVLRWMLLLVYSLAGVAAYVALWRVSGSYVTALVLLLVINVLALITAFFGEPLRTSRALDGAADNEHLRWG